MSSDSILRIMEKSSQKITIAAETDRLLIGCGLFVFIVTAMWAVFFVPMSMDEAGIYHVLACMNYPFAPLQDFRDSCQHQFTLTVPFLGLQIVQPERYIGILQTILYAPVYFIFHKPCAQYAFGLCFLLGFAWLTSRQTQKPLLSLALFLSFFPFVFQFVHDVGPVKFGLLAFPLSALLFPKMLQAQSPISYGYAAALGLLIVAATEDKPFFLYLLPSLGFFVLALSGQGNGRNLVATLKKARGPILVAAAMTAIGLFLILFSVNQDGKYYLAWLMEITSLEPARAPWVDLISLYTLYWPGYTEYFYALQNSPGVLWFELALAGFAALCAIMAIRSKFFLSGAGLRSSLLGLSFASTVYVLALAGNAYGGHHYIFLWVPLVVLLADLVATLPSGSAAIIALAFFALNLWSTIAMTQEDIQARNSPDREAIFQFFNDDAFASDALINYSSWGGYYIQALYGPKNQLVSFTAPLTPQDTERLLTLSQQTARKIYDVCFGAYCNASTLRSLFGGKLDFDDVLPGLQYWHVFAATPSNEKN